MHRGLHGCCMPPARKPDLSCTTYSLLFHPRNCIVCHAIVYVFNCFHDGTQVCMILFVVTMISFAAAMLLRNCPVTVVWFAVNHDDRA